jgi:hypothetical protein
MRVIRGVLDLLDLANAVGKKARGYWDTEVYWTFQEILPRHCPDILERICNRVDAGLDEIVLGPFNNGANHAATAAEFRAAVAWSMENPWGTGLRQLFSRVTNLYRPQECVFTTGQEQILKELGVEGLVLYYARVPFNSLGVFTPALSHEQRHNPFWFRSREDQPPLAVLPAMSAADVMEMGSLENMMLDLRRRQLGGEIRSDVVIHLNEDADLESWLPLEMPRLLRWLPNTRGLDEYIDVVNKYPWADFVVPGEYLASHPPQGEVLVRQDLADGAFDGSYSWAEKCSSLRTWTLLEQSRLASYRAEALARGTGLDLSSRLWEGMDSVFFQRLIGLSTTHFGMSTPVINEERQARADAILGEARQIAQEAEREAAGRRACREDTPGTGVLYEFEVTPTPPDRDVLSVQVRAALRLPAILPQGVENIRVEAGGERVPAALVEITGLPDERKVAEIHFTADLAGDQRYRVYPSNQAPAAALVKVLKNAWLEVEINEECGLRSFKHLGVEIGGSDFLQPFVSYRTSGQPVIYPAQKWEIIPLDGEQWQGLARVRMRALAPMQTPHGEFTNQFTYTFTLFHGLPHLYVDVEARYAATPSSETIHNMIQKLRRLMDLRWIEVAPCQIHPLLRAPRHKPLRIWKHNYLGITAYYDLNYGQVNPRNRDLDSFNHQVTAGWVAVSDGQRGLLVGENADRLASMAFCPMRLREVDGLQRLWLNPFGSYHGRQASYAHLGGTGLGEDFLSAFSGFMKPNGPSFNGQILRFSLLLAPYLGDEPPPHLQAEAMAYFYPPAVVVCAAPPGIQALLPGDFTRAAEAELRRAAIAAVEEIPTPAAFLANSSPGQVNLVWDEPRDIPVTSYEIAWRAEGDTKWQSSALEPANRGQVTGLQDGREYFFKLRALCGERCSPWTAEQASTPGAVREPGTASLSLLPKRALVRILWNSVLSVLRGRYNRLG